MLVAAQDDPSVSNITRDLLRQAALAAPAGVEQDPSATDGDATARSSATGKPAFREGEEVVRQAVLDMGKGARGEGEPARIGALAAARELALYGRSKDRITAQIERAVKRTTQRQALSYIERELVSENLREEDNVLTMADRMRIARRIYNDIMTPAPEIPLAEAPPGVGLMSK